MEGNDSVNEGQMRGGTVPRVSKVWVMTRYITTWRLLKGLLKDLKSGRTEKGTER